MLNPLTPWDRPPLKNIFCIYEIDMKTEDVKTGGGKFFQHKAYCEKHILDQKKKAESLQHGPDEVRHIKQIQPAAQSYLLRLQGLLRTIRMENAGGGNDDAGLEAAEDGWVVLS
ncbi:uncharacterized protein LOC131223846 [Magnolia sinica]|uniref:uncharacterized protein LOC131223846 n=1 Tax=Magnolia sinica TaxID=86752 RepID=UPI002658214E|nr:uncharacterized protein LOC131223846 [Magnolia sinica]XP_058075355.1 uncharacterized protein LOC131223846 [Magnolia sinica]XP_058075356.1 uncharacterized protein LOC131223846 [Magnolia sinica]